MGGVSVGSGIFSGIDTATLINQLLAIESRPKVLIQSRIIQLQTQQSAFLDLNSRLGALRSAASSFRVNRTFSGKLATSSDESVLTATARTGAVPGAYDFLVDRLVTSQQLLSRGFADRDVSPLGASAFTLESADARLDRDIELAALNGGQGISRGKINVSVGGGSAVEVDLSKAVTVNDVLEALNSTGLDLTARVEGGAFVLSSSSSDISVTNAQGSTTATSLGIAKTTATGTLTGDDVYVLSETSLLRTLNDGNGVFVSNTIGQNRFDFTISVADGPLPPVTANVNLGPVFDTDLTVLEGPAQTIGDVLDRVNAALDEIEGDASISATFTASIDSEGRITISSSQALDITFIENGNGTTAQDLGFSTSTYDSTTLISGGRILADMNDTLVRNLNGRSGLSGDGQLAITSRDGTLLNFDLSGAETLSEILRTINDDATNAGRIVASLNDAGTGLLITDTTAGANNLIISGDAGTALGIATDVAGVGASSVRGGDLEHAYVTRSTSLDVFNNGKGIGTGSFRITDGFGRTAVIDIGTDTKTVDQLINEINSIADAQGVTIEAALNDSGDGIVIREKDGTPQGANAIRVEDASGSVARNLGIAGEAPGTGADNVIDGSLETLITFEAGDTLDDVVEKINDAGGQATVSILNDGSQGSPFRLTFSARSSGRDGRFVLDTQGFDLGLSVLEAGEDARVFFGSSDPARAVLLTSSTNTLDGVIPGVSVDLRSVSEDPVTLTISTDTGKIESQVDAFVSAFNAIMDRIDFHTRFVQETETRGALLGDSTTLTLKQALLNVVQGEALNVPGRFTRLLDVGIGVGEGGKLELDKERLREAMEEDFASVAALFETRTLEARDEFIEVAPGVRVKNTSTDDEFSALGVAGQVEELIKDYIDSIDGTLTLRGKALDTQITLQEGRIEAFDIRLAQKRARLEQQFLVMEQTIASLQSQQASLRNLNGLLG